MTTTPKRFSCLRPNGGLRASALALALSLGALSLNLTAPAWADDTKKDKSPSQPGAAPEDARPPARAVEPRKLGTEKGRATNPHSAHGEGAPEKDLALGKEQRGQVTREDGTQASGLPRLTERSVHAKKPLSREAALENYKHALAALKDSESAPPKAGDPAEAGPDESRKEALKAARRARNDLRAAHRAQAMEFLEKNEEQIQQLRTDLKARSDTAGADRKERTEMQVETLKKEWGEKASQAPVRAELTRHAWRVARLERLIAIAEVSGRDDQAARAKELLEKEKASHPERLKEAAASAGKGPAVKPVRAVPGGGATPTNPTAPAQAPPKTEGGAQ